jgi:hypothetical protein
MSGANGSKTAPLAGKIARVIGDRWGEQLVVAPLALGRPIPNAKGKGNRRFVIQIQQIQGKTSSIYIFISFSFLPLVEGGLEGEVLWAVGEGDLKVLTLEAGQGVVHEMAPHLLQLLCHLPNQPILEKFIEYSK